MTRIVKNETESILRQAVYFAIKGNESSFEAELNKFSPEDQIIVACALATDTVAMIIAEQYRGIPSSEAVLELATRTASLQEEWSGIGVADLAAFVNSIITGTPVEESIPLGVAVRVPFVLLAFLLLQFHKDGEPTFDYLDRLWNELEDRA